MAYSFLIFALGLCLASPPLSAQESLLGEVALGFTALVVDLEAATVRIVSGDIVEPQIRWWRERPDEPGADALLVTEDAGVVVIERPVLAEGDTFARLMIDAVVTVDQSMRVVGSGIDLSLERELISQVEPMDPDEKSVVATPVLVELHLTDSQASLTGVGPVNATLDRSAVQVLQTTGSHRIEAYDSELRFFGHRGNISLTTQAADVMAENANGQFSFQGVGGSVEMRSTQGRLNIQAEGTQIQLLDSGGIGVVHVTDSNVDIRGATFQNLNLRGVSSHATISSFNGTTNTDFTGGSLAVDDGAGRLIGNARTSASIEITEHQGDIWLNLQQDSSADIREITGEVNITSQRAQIMIDDVVGLTLKANETRATISSISKLRSFQATASEIDLDLTECTARNSTVSVQGESFVRVFMRTPCRVQATGVEGLANQVDVGGCEFKVGNGRKWPSKNVRGVDGQAAIMLTAQVAANAELVVEGRP